MCGVLSSTRTFAGIRSVAQKMLSSKAALLSLRGVDTGTSGYKKHNHSLKIKAKVRARGVRSQQWYSEQRVQYLRKKVRAQNLWNLHLAGDWHFTMETAARGPRPHMMRVMLISNIAVNERFANGTQGRLLHWHPGSTESKRRALPAYCSDLLARFCKESSLSKQEMLPDMDFMDLGARQETLNIRGEPILLQLCVVPAYALTIHKTQALSIKHLVLGSLEGVFALGQDVCF